MGKGHWTFQHQGAGLVWRPTAAGLCELPPAGCVGAEMTTAITATAAQQRHCSCQLPPLGLSAIALQGPLAHQGEEGLESGSVAGCGIELDSG